MIFPLHFQQQILDHCFSLLRKEISPSRSLLQFIPCELRASRRRHIDDELRPFPSGNEIACFCPPIFFEALAFPRERPHPVFAIAAAAWFWVEKCCNSPANIRAESDQRSISTQSESSCATTRSRAPERLARRVFFADCHQARHFRSAMEISLRPPIESPDCVAIGSRGFVFLNVSRGSGHSFKY